MGETYKEWRMMCDGGGGGRGVCHHPLPQLCLGLE